MLHYVARPDRLDFRDREFRPRLTSQPEQYPSNAEIAVFFRKYAEKMVLNQGDSLACTGFALAAVINYLKWLERLRAAEALGENIETLEVSDAKKRVSSVMLYNAAKVYDEWEGEDYEGSSCRGAMKGWHKHGVCSEERWPFGDDGERTKPSMGWSQEGAKNPLGAYYRVNNMSIADMQSAIFEVGAVYCSASIHQGWAFQHHTERPSCQHFEATDKDGSEIQRFSLPIIPMSDDELGGHAFSLVGYTERGFIVQNSWGSEWGTKWDNDARTIRNAAGGFALLTYEDWIENSHDAWVSAMAAPMMVSGAAADEDNGIMSRSRHSLLELTAQTRAATARMGATVKSGGVELWSEQKAHKHSIVMGNNGKLMRRRLDHSSGQMTIEETIANLLSEHPNGDVMIYAHGGLNNEKAAIERAQTMGPWFEKNGILPIFVVWRTGIVDAVQNIGQDMLADYFTEMQRVEKSGIFGFVRDAKRKLERKFDSAFEAVAEKVIGKAVWSQIKQNAEAACQRNGVDGTTGGMRVLADVIKKQQLVLEKAGQKRFRVHLMGHSAGANILTHFAQDLARFSEIGSFGLIAPACTLRFANQKIQPLIAGRGEKEGVLPAEKFYVVNLSRGNERDDTVGPYNKSLLYLVSRALETPRKSPLLGLDDAWVLKTELPKGDGCTPEFNVLDDEDYEQVKDMLGNYYAAQELGEIVKWRRFAVDHGITYQQFRDENVVVRKMDHDVSRTQAVHGSLDNDVNVINFAIQQIRGEVKEPVTDLTGA